MKRLTFEFPALLTLLLAAAAPPLIAQTEAPGTAQADDGGQPGRSVARLSLMNGDVSVRRGDSGDWIAGAINAPLLTEDRVFSGARSRAEVQFDYYHRIRLAGETEVRLSDIENGKYLLQVARGTATFTALKGGDAQVEISTQAAAIRPVAYGNYRVTVREDGSAEITVRSGEAEIYTPTGTQRLKPGKTMLVRTEGGQAVFQVVAALEKDDWDRFNENRDKELKKGLETYKYVSRDVYGAEDLQGNGEWVYVAPYGNVWRPYVATGWAPYRYGRWSWVDWYGWSWVSYDPWGWAPYHYGRWFNYGGNWCWYPGAHHGMRHYWSPGVVAWFGWGGVGVGVGWGSVGWVPLAPYEPFHRWWGHGHYRGYRGGNVYNNTTIVNNVNISNVYRNARVNNAISVAEGNDFSRGMRGQAYRGGENNLQRASLVRGAMPVTPQRESLRFADRDARAVPSARSAGNGNFYARTQPRSVDRVPFETQRQAIQSVEQRTASTLRRGGDAVETSRGRTAEASGSTPASSGRNVRAGEPAQSGWRSAGDPASSRSGGRETGAAGGMNTAPRSGEAAGTESRSGWRTFGDPSGARTSRTGEQSRGGEVASPASPSTESRTGSRGFGDPGRSARSESLPRTGGEVSDGARNYGTSRTTDTPSGRTDSGRGAWSTRGGEGSSNPGSTRVESPTRSNESWSTRPSVDRGGGAASRSDSPRTETQRSESPRVQPQRSEAPRMEQQRSEPARQQAPARTEAPARTGSSPSRSEPARTGRGNSDDMAGARSGAPSGMSSGFVSGGSTARWSTRGSDGAGGSSRSVAAESGTSGFSARTGSGGGAMSTSRSAPSGGSWTSGSGSGSRSAYSGSDTGSRSGMSRSQSYGGYSTRSAPSYGGGSGGGISSPSYGGGSRSYGGGMSSRSSGGFGGGGGMSAPSMSSGGGMRSSGGSMRSSGGSSGGSMRSGGGGGGGGRSGGGGGRR